MKDYKKAKQSRQRVVEFSQSCDVLCMKKTVLVVSVYSNRTKEIVVSSSSEQRHIKYSKSYSPAKKDMESTNPRYMRAISLLPDISKISEECINNYTLELCKKIELINNR